VTRREEAEMEEEEPTGEELREAAALARALAGESPGSALPRGALEVAALLDLARDGGRLAPEQRARVAARLAGDAPPVRGRASRRRFARPLAWAGPLAAAALLFLVLRGNLGDPRRELPRAPAVLLEVQARAARGDRAALGELDRAMQSYRRDVYAGLGLLPESTP
jgi:hypothetical protein